jgi:uncharacterized protein (TIRG00374 family)
MPVKWNILLRAKQITIGYGAAIKIYFVASYLGLYLPPTVGADAVRAYYINRYGYKYTDSISAILVERFIGFIALLLFGISGCLIFYKIANDVQFDLRRILIIAVACTILVMFIFILSFNIFISKIITTFLHKISGYTFLKKFADIFTNLYTSYIDFSRHKLALFMFFILTLLEVSLPIVRSYILALAFNVHVPFAYFFAFVPIVLLLIRLPISIDGFGLHEAGYVYFLSLVGVPSADGLAIGLINHLIFIVGILPGGIIYLFHTVPHDKVPPLPDGIKSKPFMPTGH